MRRENIEYNMRNKIHRTTATTTLSIKVKRVFLVQVFIDNIMVNLTQVLKAKG